MATAGPSKEDVAEETRPLLGKKGGETSKAQEEKKEKSIAPSSASPPADQSKKSSLMRQIFLGFVAALPSLPPGMSLGFSAISFGQLDLSVDEASWFASVTVMAFPIGSIIVGPLMDKYGRRPALLSINIVSLVGWLMLSVHTSNPTMFKLITGRILTGIAAGLASVPGSVYAAECLSSADLGIRSAMVTWSTVALAGGIFLVYFTGVLLPYYAVASIATLISIMSFILVAIYLPESPAWLTMKGRFGDAEWSLREINISPPPKPIEQPSEAEDVPLTRAPPPEAPPAPKTFEELMKPEAYKPLLIMIGFFFFQQFSGVFVIIAYMVDFILAAGVVTLSPYVLTAIGGGVVLVVSFLGSLIYPSTGVRAIAVLSGAGTAASMLFIGAFLSFRIYWVTRPMWYFLHWVPVIAILVNIGISTIGFLILPYSMLGEVFPLNVKGIAAGIATSCGFIFSFIAAKTYPYIQLGIGVDGIFFFFGGMALLGTIFVILYLPETRGRTLQEIVDSFKKKKPAKAAAESAPPPAAEST